MYMEHVVAHASPVLTPTRRSWCWHDGQGMTDVAEQLSTLLAQFSVQHDCGRTFELILREVRHPMPRILS